MDDGIATGFAIGMAMRMRNERIDHHAEIWSRQALHDEELLQSADEIGRLRFELANARDDILRARRETEAERRRSADLERQLAAANAKTERTRAVLTRSAVHEHAKAEALTAALATCIRLDPGLIAMKPVDSADGLGKPAAVTAYEAAFDAKVVSCRQPDLKGDYGFPFKIPASALPKPSGSPGTARVVSPRTFILEARMPVRGAA